MTGAVEGEEGESLEPTSRAYDEGNYEPISARCAKGSGETLVAVATRLLTELHAQKN